MSTSRLPPLKTVVPYEIVGLMTIMAFFLPGGDDLYRFYRPLAEGCLTCAYNPWHTAWLVFPLRFVPLRLLWPLWTLLTGLCLIAACQAMQVNAIYVLLSFPAMGLIWLGQVEGLVVAGLVLALAAQNPYLRGLGVVMASIKPQVSGVAILLLIWHDQQRLKMILIPALVLLGSVIAWGIDWPIRWLEARDLEGVPVWGRATLYPVGLLAFLAVLAFREKRQQVTVTLLAGALGVPWFGVYSYIVFLTLLMPWWALPLSYAWIVGYPWLDNRAVGLAWILPLSLLGYLLWPVVRRRWIDGRAGASPAGSLDLPDV
jgi:hypothetical protein